jgi:hypothetical protein
MILREIDSQDSWKNSIKSSSGGGGGSGGKKKAE